MTNDSPNPIKLDEAATRLAVSPRTVERWAHTGRLPYLKLGSAIRFDPADLDAFLSASKKEVLR